MSLKTIEFSRISHVELRVRNLPESVDFYSRMFGLEPAEAIPPSSKVCICRAMGPAGAETFSVVLTEGLPAGTELSGMDHISLEVPSPDDVHQLYAKACALKARATRPRHFDGGFQTFIFDPNGYKIEVVARRAMTGTPDGDLRFQGWK